MPRLLVVREYDSITCNADYANNNSFKYLEEKYFDELEHFVKEYTSYQNDTDVLEFMKIGYKRGVGDVISFNNNVGIIELPSGFQIEILPKLALDDDGNNSQTKAFFLNMLRCLKEFEGKSFTNAMLNADKMNLYEVFINMYIQETRLLLKGGLKSAYQNHEENIKFYKGKLSVSNHIKNNIVHKERFYMQFDEYHINRAENRLIKATLLKLMAFSRSQDNIKSIRQMLNSFELVDESVNYEKDFNEISTSRDSKDYALLMQWSKVFLLNKSFTTFSGEKIGKALLFPMEQVFEAFVAKWVKYIFTTGNTIQVTAQDKGYYLFDEPQKFRLRPDIVVRQQDGKTIILDTKWKILNTNPNQNYGISQADMYQMYAYAKKYNTSDICLIYPYYEGIKEINGKTFETVNEEEQQVQVKIFLVDLRRYEESIRELYDEYYT